jgi:prevent-host-death family protein
MPYSEKSLSTPKRWQRCNACGTTPRTWQTNWAWNELAAVAFYTQPFSSDMYKSWFGKCTVHGVDVSVTELRAHLSDWLDRARAGGEVVITDRGIPVARLAALDSTGTLERLTAEGVIGKATAQRPVAAGRSGPRPRRPVSDRVSDQRR